MQEQEQKHSAYLVPPDLGQVYMIMGMTVPEIVFVVLSFFIALGLLLYQHTIKVFLVPVTSVMLFVRMTDNINLLSILIRRITYFLSSQQYSLNPRR